MKTLKTILTLLLLVVATVCFATADNSKPEKNSNVPLAPSVWENSEIETPELLKFVKAKNAFVPVAGFDWGNPSDTPENILAVPVAPFILGDSMEDALEDLAFIKAKFLLVPIAPFVWGDSSEEVVVR